MNADAAAVPPHEDILTVSRNPEVSYNSGRLRLFSRVEYELMQPDSGRRPSSAAGIPRSPSTSSSWTIRATAAFDYGPRVPSPPVT